MNEQGYITLHLPLAKLAEVSHLTLAQLLLGSGGAQPPAEIEEDEDAEVPINSGTLIDLPADLVGQFFSPIDPLYQKGVRLFAEKGAPVAWSELEAIGIERPGHFKSRMSLRAKKVMGSKVRVQFCRYVPDVAPDGSARWVMEVSPTTLASLRTFFGIK